MARRHTRVNDPVLLTVSGAYVNPLDLHADQVHVEDVAHALSNQCRFAGHTRRFYSVAEHAVRVSLALLTELSIESVEEAMWGLHHDDPEYVLGDLQKPIKHSPVGELYREAEGRAMSAIAEAFQLADFVAEDNPDGMPKRVKEADRRMLLTERRDLLPGYDVDPWKDGNLQPYRERIVNPWPAEHAKWEYLRRHAYLVRQRDRLYAEAYGEEEAA